MGTIAGLLDEAILKLISLALRFLQLALSLAIIGGMSQFVSDISNWNSTVPEPYVAVIAMAAVTATWSGIALLLTLCAGRLVLEIETGLDLVCASLSIAETALMSRDARSSGRAFAAHLQEAMGMMTAGNLSYDQSLARMAFVMAVILMLVFIPPPFGTCRLSNPRTVLSLPAPL